VLITIRAITTLNPYKKQKLKLAKFVFFRGLYVTLKLSFLPPVAYYPTTSKKSWLF